MILSKKIYSKSQFIRENLKLFSFLELLLKYLAKWISQCIHLIAIYVLFKWEAVSFYFEIMFQQTAFFFKIFMT